MKLFLSIIFIIGSLTVHSQANKFVNAKLSFESGKLTEARAEIDAAIAHVQTKDDHKTWKLRGDIYFALFISPDYQDNSKLWRIGALESYSLAIKKHGSYKHELQQNITYLGSESLNEGVDLFKESNFNGAIQAFNGSVEAFALLDVVDSLAFLNIALANERKGEHLEAIKYYNLCIELKYKERECYSYVVYSYQKLGDEENTERVLTEALNKFPNHQNFILIAINEKFRKGDTAGAIELLKRAIEGDSKNIELHFSIGSMYDEIGKTLLAEKSYLEALKLNPNHFGACYNLGALYFNLGVESNNAMIDIVDPDLYLAKQKKTNELFEKALKPLESALEVKPGDRSALSSLQQLYLRLDRGEDYERVNKLLEEE